MSILNNVINSIEHYIKINPDIKAFSYSDNTLFQDLVCNSKVDLVGTEVKFIVQNGGADLTSTEYPSFLLYRYLEFNGIKKQIIAYNNITGEVTIESAFGMAILSTDIFDLKIVDSIFIYKGNPFDDVNGTKSAQKTTNRFYFRVVTKDDVKGERNELLVEQLKNIFYVNYFGLRIYDDATFTTNKSFTSLGNGTFNENVLDIKNNDYVYLLSVPLSYYVNYK